MSTRPKPLTTSYWGQVGKGVEKGTAGLWMLLRTTYAGFVAHHGNMRAAAIAYYVVLSFFPLVALLIVSTSSILTREDSRQAVCVFVERYMPGIDQLVQLNIEKVLLGRGWATVLSVLGLVWSGSNVFASIHASFNEIWDVLERRSFWWQRLLGIAAVGAILSTFALSMVITTLGQIISNLPALSVGLISVEYGRLWGTITRLVGIVPTILLFFAIYYLFSSASLRWSELLPTSIVSAIVWEISKQFFTRYITVFEPYNLVYGALGRFIAFVIWSYFTGVILLMGAELPMAWRKLQSSE